MFFLFFVHQVCFFPKKKIKGYNKHMPKNTVQKTAEKTAESSSNAASNKPAKTTTKQAEKPTVEPVVAVAVAAPAAVSVKKGGSKKAAAAPVEVTVAPVAVAPVVAPVAAKKGSSKKAAAVPVEAPVAVAPVTVAPVAAKKGGSKKAASAQSAAAPSAPVVSAVAEPESKKKQKGGKAKKIQLVDDEHSEEPEPEQALEAAADGTLAAEGNQKKHRYFKCVHGGEVKGRFSGNKPKQAANKALTSIVKNSEDGDLTGQFINFSIIECTRGSKRKEYKYKGMREKLTTPMQVSIGSGAEQKNITYNFNNKVQKLKANEV